MRTAIIPRLLLSVLLVLTFTLAAGCAAVAGIFKAGVFSGLVIAIVVIALVVFLFSRLRR